MKPELMRQAVTIKAVPREPLRLTAAPSVVGHVVLARHIAHVLKLTLVFTTGLFAACGARTSLQVAPQEKLTEDAGVDAKPSQADSSGSPDLVRSVDTTPPLGPCHLVRTGDPIVSIEFAEASQSFRANGLLMRTQVPADVGQRVVHYGNVSGIRLGAWSDPPIYAAELDVSTWPPTVIHAKTELATSMHSPADLVEFREKFGLAWSYDADGGQGLGIRYRVIDALTWKLEPHRSLVVGEDSIPVEGLYGQAPLEVTVGRDAFITAYNRRTASGQTFQLLALFGSDGSARGPAIRLFEREQDSANIVPTVALARVGTSFLMALGFSSCDAKTSAYCEPGAIVILRVTPSANGLELVTVASVPFHNEDKLPRSPALITDGDEHVWLTWWEGVSTSSTRLNAIALSPIGKPIGTVTRWYEAADAPLGPLSARPASAGPLGVVYAAARYIGEEGARQREVHLLHRDLNTGDEMAELVFITTATTSPVSVVQFPHPRTLIVGYSTSVSGGRGELMKYECRGDR